MPVDLLEDKEPVDLLDSQARESIHPEHATSSITGEDILNPLLTSPEMVSAMQFANRRMPGIDYFSGVRDAGFRAGFSKSDNEKERRAYLTRVVGKDNWSKDKFGAFLIHPKGMDKLKQKHNNMPVALDEQGSSLMDVADMRGDAPAIAGAIVFASLTGGMGAPAAMAFTGLGAAGFKGYDESIEALEGENLQSPLDVSYDMLMTGGEAAMGEGIYRGIMRPLGRKLLAPEAARMTDRTRELVRMASDIDVKANVTQITKAPILGRTQSMINRIFTDQLSADNATSFLKEAARLRTLAGKEVLKKKDIGLAVSRAIQKSREQFSHATSKAYQTVDDVVGGKEIIPTRLLKRQAASILDDLPKSADGTPVFTSPEMRSSLSDVMSMPEHVTAKQMQAIRGVLFDNFQTNNLVPGMTSRQTKGLWKAAGKTFDDAHQQVNLFAGLSENQIKGSMTALKNANKVYSQGIKKFDDQLVARITRDPSLAGALDPDMLVETIFKKGNPLRVAKIRKLVPKDKWELVQRKSMDDILKKMSSRTDDPRISLFDGKKLLNTLDDYGRETLEEMFDKPLTDQLYRFGEVVQFATQEMAKSGGIVAAHIALHPMDNIGKLVRFNIMSRFMNSRLGMKWLTEGLAAPKTRAGTQAIMRAALLMATIADQETGIATFSMTAPPKPEDIQTVADNPL